MGTLGFAGSKAVGPLRVHPDRPTCLPPSLDTAHTIPICKQHQWIAEGELGPSEFFSWECDTGPEESESHRGGMNAGGLACMCSRVLRKDR